MEYHFRSYTHLFPINLGYIAVDFFFIVSGFYFGLSIIKVWNKRSNVYLDNLKMLWKKIKKFFPYSMVATILACIGSYFLGHVPISKLLLNFFGMLFLSSFGIGEDIIGSIWFISSMLISMAIIYPLLRKLKVNYIYFWAPLTVLFSFGILYRNYPNLNIYDMALNNYILGGLIRVFADINIGVILSYVIQNSNLTIKPVKLYICIVSFIEFFLYAFTIAIIIFYPKSSHLDFLVIPIMILALTISFSEVSYSSKILSNKFVYYLEKLSMPLMFNHILFQVLLRYITFKSLSNDLIFFMISIISLVFTIIEYHLLNLIISKINIKKFLVEKEKA